MSPILSTFSIGSRPAPAPGFELTYVDSAFSATHQITVPATAAAGDLVIINWMGRTNWTGGFTLALPSGWTRIFGQTSSFLLDSDMGIDCFFKKIVSGDVSSTITCANSGWTLDATSLIVFRPSHDCTYTAPTGYYFEYGPGDPADQSIDFTAENTPHVVMAWYKSDGGTIDPRTETSGTFTELNSGVTNYQKYRIFNTDASRITTTIGMEDEARQSLSNACVYATQL